VIHFRMQLRAKIDALEASGRLVEGGWKGSDRAVRLGRGHAGDRARHGTSA
jgi:hypothetical protein